MTTYKVFDNAGRIIEYGYYDAGRGHLDVKAEDITDGDTKVQEITGTSVAVYAPYTSPNNTSSPQLLVGDTISQGLYITIASNEVDGVVLKAPNDLANNVGNSSRARLVGATGTVTDPTGDSAFNTYISPGDQATFTWIRPEGGETLMASTRY